MRPMLSVFAVFLAVAGAAPASAQTTPAAPSPTPGETVDLRAPGRLNAQAYRDVPATGSVRVRPYDDTRENRRLQTQIERAVERKGRRIEDKAADSEDSLVNPRRAELGSSGSVQYTMVISLDDARGTRLWQGTATLLGAPGDETSAYGSMARALIDEFGQTARQKPFRVE